MLTSMFSVMFIKCIWLNDKTYEDFEIYTILQTWM
jgi:hypothetical protein